MACMRIGLLGSVFETVVLFASGAVERGNLRVKTSRASTGVFVT